MSFELNRPLFHVEVQVMFTYELAKRLEQQKLPVVANALDPGIVDTELQRYLSPPAPAAVMRFAKSPVQGAATSVQLALEESGSGGYWVDGQRLGRGGLGGAPRGGRRAWGEGPRHCPSTRSWRWRGALEGLSSVAAVRSTSYDEVAWEALWRRSAVLAGVKTI